MLFLSKWVIIGWIFFSCKVHGGGLSPKSYVDVPAELRILPGFGSKGNITIVLGYHVDYYDYRHNAMTVSVSCQRISVSVQ